MEFCSVFWQDVVALHTATAPCVLWFDLFIGRLWGAIECISFCSFHNTDCAAYQQKYRQICLVRSCLTHLISLIMFYLSCFYFAPSFFCLYPWKHDGFLQELMHFTVSWFKFCSKCPLKRDFYPLGVRPMGFKSLFFVNFSTVCYSGN